MVALCGSAPSPRLIHQAPYDPVQLEINSEIHSMEFAIASQDPYNIHTISVVRI